MLEIQGLSKSYGNNVAVDNVDFTVPDGQVGILLGHDICLKENSRWFGLRAFDWNLILTSQGSCSVSSGQEFSCEMEFGSLTLFPPGAPRNYRIKEEWSCYWCHFVTGMVVQWPKLPGGMLPASAVPRTV